MSNVRFSLKFHAAKDADVIARLREFDNVNDYIRQLVRADAIMSGFLKFTEEENTKKEDVKNV